MGFFYDLLLDHVSDRWNNDAIQGVLNSLRAMLDLHQETARGHSDTLLGLPGQGQTGSYVDALGTLPPLLNQNAQTGYDIQAEAEQVAERAWESTTEAAVEADTGLEADATVSTFVDTFTGPVGWLITTLIEVGIGAFIIYEFVQTVEDIVRDFQRLFPTTTPQQQPVSPPGGTPQNSGAPPRRIQLDDPFVPLTETEQQRLKSLRHEFGGMDLEIIALIRAGYTDEEIRRILRNILAWMDRNGVKYDRNALLFAIVMAHSEPQAGKIVFLEQGNPFVGWDHILNGTDPVTDPGHRDDFKRLLGLTSDDQIMWLIMNALAEGTPIDVKPDGRGGSIYEFAVAQGVVLFVVVSSNGFIITAYPRSTF